MSPPVPPPLLVTIGDVVDAIGSARPFHRVLTVMVGLMFGAEVMEIFLLTYISKQLQDEFVNSSDDAMTSFSVSMLATAIFLGMLCGSLISGPLSDRTGRRITSVGFMTIGAVAGLLSTWSPNLTVLLGFRFLVGFSAGGGHIASTLMLELIPTSAREWYTAVTFSVWSLGTMLQCAAAYYLLVVSGYSWRVFVFASALPMTALAIAAFYLVPESPRWLLLHDGRDKRKTASQASKEKMNRHPGEKNVSNITNNNSSSKFSTLTTTSGAFKTADEEAIEVLRWIHRYQVSSHQLDLEHKAMLKQQHDNEGKLGIASSHSHSLSGSSSQGAASSLSSSDRSCVSSGPVDLGPILEVLWGDSKKSSSSTTTGSLTAGGSDGSHMHIEVAGGGGPSPSDSPPLPPPQQQQQAAVLLFGSHNELTAYRNGLEENEKEKEDGTTNFQEVSTVPAAEDKKLSFFQALTLVLSPEYRRLTLSFWLVWGMVASSYYGLSMLTTSQFLENSAYLSIFVAGAGELPCYPLLWWAPKKFGRRRCLQAPALACIALLVWWGLLSNFGADDETTTTTGPQDSMSSSHAADVSLGSDNGGGEVATGGHRMSSAIGALIVGALRCLLLFMFDVAYIFSPESYPIHIRTTASGFCSACARICSAVTPLIAFPLKVSAGPLAAYVFFGTLFYLLFVGASFAPYETTSVDIDDEEGKRATAAADS